MHRAVFGKIMYPLLIILAAFQLLPHIISDHTLKMALRPLFAAAFSDPPGVSVPCDDQDGTMLTQLSENQRLVIGSALVSSGCMDIAARILPDLTATQKRLALLAYQWGMIAWHQGDLPQAAAFWRYGKDIDQRLLIQARHLKETDVSEAQRWYEAAIMSAGSPQMLAESITAYSEELRGRVFSELFRERLMYLESYFGADTAVGYRLRGERSLRGGSYQVAYELLSQAIALGVTDAETWYLLGDAAWELDDLLTTEQAYRAALEAPLQITWRRPWHMHRLAALLTNEERLDEALPFQEAAVRLSDYYSYSDSLSVLYQELGQMSKAQTFCARARMLVGSDQKHLRCEEQ